MAKPSSFYTLDQWFSNFSLYQDHLESLLKWTVGPSFQFPQVWEGVGGSISDKSQVMLQPLAQVPPLGWRTSYSPPAQDRQLPEETRGISSTTTKKVTSICILEPKANLQKQIFLSEQICLAFTPRNRPHTGSPWQALAATWAQISQFPKLSKWEMLQIHQSQRQDSSNTGWQRQLLQHIRPRSGTWHLRAQSPPPQPVLICEGLWAPENSTGFS